MSSHRNEIACAALVAVFLIGGFAVLRHVSHGSRAIEHDAWSIIQVKAGRSGLDPGFVYALVAAESGFDPHAQRGQARGMMQLTPKAWASASKVPYPGAVWDWRINLTVGMDRLAALRRDLTQRGVFSYPMLFAAYHYSVEYLAARKFDLHRVSRPEGPIARRLWSGEINPVAPPH